MSQITVLTTSGSSTDSSSAIRNVVGGLCDQCKKSEKDQLAEAKPNAIARPNSKVEQIFGKRSINEVHDPIIGRVPLEISSYIFELCVQPRRRQRIRRTTRTKFYGVPPGPVLRLGAVCSFWRSIAWSFPRLWTTLVVDIRSKGCHYSRELAVEWIQRAGNLPLSIYLYDSDDFFYEANNITCADCVYQNALSLINVINAFSSRWETLSLSIPLELLQYIGDDESDDGRPSVLRRLNIGVVLEDRDEDARTLVKKFNRKHSPISVTLLDPPGLDVIDIEWTNVIFFHAVEIGHLHACEAIRRAPLLRTCQLTLLNPDFDDPEDGEFIVAEYLSSLSISDKGGGGI